MEIIIKVNGRRIAEQIEPDLLLIDFLRKHGCYSVKRGCETASCGLCTVLMDNTPVLSCSVLAARADGHEIYTLEGLQEEAPSLGKPVLVLRRETERPEAIEAGTVKLAGVEQADIVKLARELFEDETAYARMAHAVNPYGDGKTSQRIVEAIEHYFGLREDGPAPFNP